MHGEGAQRNYTRLIRQFKPEHHPEQFRRIRDAYEHVQRDPELFAHYDVTQEPSDDAKSERETNPSEAVEELQSVDGDFSAVPPQSTISIRSGNLPFRVMSRPLIADLPHCKNAIHCARRYRFGSIGYCSWIANSIPTESRRIGLHGAFPRLGSWDRLPKFTASTFAGFRRRPSASVSIVCCKAMQHPIVSLKYLDGAGRSLDVGTPGISLDMIRPVADCEFNLFHEERPSSACKPPIQIIDWCARTGPSACGAALSRCVVKSLATTSTYRFAEGSGSIDASIWNPSSKAVRFGGRSFML